MVTTKDILDILDLARIAQTQKGCNFVPLLVGHSGIGKTSICKQWAQQNDVEVLDLRLSLMEGPELIGLPTIEKRAIGASSRTTFALPDFWPTDEDTEVLIILEEINKSPTLTMNSILQLLTERQIHTYTLPSRCTLVATINPENSDYTVNQMDTALKNRFCRYDVKYDKKSFLDYAKQQNWNKLIISFIKDGHWEYKEPEKLGDSEIYISPRSWEQINTLFVCGIGCGSSLFKETCLEQLGGITGHNFILYLREVGISLTYCDFILSPTSSTQKIIDMFNATPLKFDAIEMVKRSIIDNLDEINDATITIINDKIGNNTDIRSIFLTDILKAKRGKIR